ncbi:hypothetical protein [Sediminibacillus massiliensis]|uniref:hypothetical protein n=1 Tax=Sediminibacillus massiliensis TaxID=1926277 RepID=UPI0009887869|nr:hypothetical protein [Sediminibacillus massiliensis]
MSLDKIKIGEKESLASGAKKVNAAIDAADRAENKSNQAINISNEAKTESDKAIKDSEAALRYNVGKYLQPVATLSDLASTYPNPEENDRVFIRDTGKVFVRKDGEWFEFSEITTGPVNEVDQRLSSQIEATEKKVDYFKSIKENESLKIAVANGWDWTAAFQKTVDDSLDGGVIIFPPTETYYLGNVSSEGKSLSVISYGARIIQNVNSPVMSFKGGWEETSSISSISETNYDFSGEGSIITDKITLSTTPAFKKGDVIKVVSDDEIEGAKQSATGVRRKGEFAVVGAVEGEDVVLTSKLRETYITSPRVSKLKNITFTIEGFKFDSLNSGDSSGWNASYITIKAARDITLNDLQCEKGYGSFVTLTGIYGYSVTDTHIKNLKNDPATGSYGYGINDISCEYGSVNSTLFINCRHGYTTNTNGVEAGSTEIESFGRSANTTVKGFGHGCSNSAFDTHDEAYNIHFRGCTVYGNYKGKSASGTAFSARGRKIQFTDCVAENCRYAFNIFEGFPNSTKDIFITDCKAFNIVGAAVIVNKTGTGQIVNNVFIKGGYFELLRGSVVFDLADSNGRIEGVKIKCKTNSSYARMIKQTRSDFIVENLTVDLSEYSLSGSRIFTTNEGSKMKAKDVKVIYGGGSVHLVAEGDSSTTKCEIIDFSGNQEVATDKDIPSFLFSSANDYNNTFYFLNQTINTNVDAHYKIGQSLHDNIYLKVNPSTDSIGFYEFPAGNRRGQTLTIKNDSSMNTLVIRSSSSYRTELRMSQPVTLQPKDVITLLWNGSSWSSM